MQSPPWTVSISGEVCRSLLPISSLFGLAHTPLYGAVSASVAVHVAITLSILALLLSTGDLTSCKTDFKISISMSMALRVSPLTGVTLFKAAHRSSRSSQEGICLSDGGLC